MKHGEVNRHPALKRHSGLLLAGVLAYPLTVHLAIINSQLTLGTLILLSPCFIALTNRYPGLVRAGLAILLVLGLLQLRRFDDDFARLFLYLPPVAINASLATIFGLSLRRGEMPLVTRFAQHLGDPMSPTILAYTRGVTWLWTGLFLALALESLILALFAPLVVWSMFANVLNYLIVATVFIGEFFYRRLRLTEINHPSLIGFVHALRGIRIDELSKP